MDLLGDLIDRLFLPPGLLLLLLTAAVVLAILRRRRAALVTACTALSLISALSLRPVADALLSPLEDRYPALLPADAGALGARAIVLLGGGTTANDELGPVALSRAVTAAILARQTSLPIVASGGPPAPGEPAEADVAARLLIALGLEESGIVRETGSRTTWENGTGVRDLYPEGPLILVTSALHMPRAVASFRAAGLDVVPAPADRAALHRRLRFRDWLPEAGALGASLAALHEYAGLAAYALVHGVSLSDR